MNNYSDVKQLLVTMKNVSEYIRGTSEQLNPAVYADALDAIMNINVNVFDSPVVNYNDVKECLTEYRMHSNIEIADKCVAWKEFVLSIINNRISQSNIWDMKFIKLMDYVRYVDYEIIYDNSKKILLKSESSINKDNGNDVYAVLEDRIHQLIDHRDDFIWLYNKLSDYRSRVVLCCMLLNWITFDPDTIHIMQENNFPDCFDLDLVKCSDKEVFVDLGAFTGDTTKKFINTYGSYKKIYCYELAPSSFEKMQENLSTYTNVELRNRVAGDYEDYSNQNTIERGDTTQTKIVTIDEDVPERVTMIKMDIEGDECSAINGCSSHLLNDRPKLLLSVYHNNEDIWKIPILVNSIRNDYKYYLRSNGELTGTTKITLYAL